MAKDVIYKVSMKTKILEFYSPTINCLNQWIANVFVQCTIFLKNQSAISPFPILFDTKGAF